MKTVKREIHNELTATMNRAREWMSSPFRSRDEVEKWYPAYEKLVNELAQLEKEMWEPFPW